MWIYGVNNFSKDVSLMIGSQPNIVTKVALLTVSPPPTRVPPAQVLWAVVCPVVLLVIFCLSLYFWSPPQYSGSVPYPQWAHWLGWGLVGLSAVQVPGTEADHRVTPPLGAPVGGADDPGVPVQEEGSQGGQTYQGLGAGRPSGDFNIWSDGLTV